MKKYIKEFLRELIIGIFKTELVEYENEKITVCSKSIFYKCNKSSIDNLIRYKKHFVNLLELAFVNSNVRFFIDTEGGNYKPEKPKSGQVQFSREEAIVNAYNYLKSLDINIELLGDIKKLDFIDGNKVIFEAFCKILDFIFDYDAEIIENFSEEFINAKTSIEMEFLKIHCGTIGYENTTSDNSVVEIYCSKEECNYYISVNMTDIGIPNVANIDTIVTSATILNNVEKKKPTNEFLNICQTGFGIYDPKRDIVYKQLPVFEKYEDYMSITTIESDTFKISDVILDCSAVNLTVVYYLTHLNMEKIKILYHDIKNLYELRLLLIERGRKEISALFEKKIVKYYLDVIRYIDDLLEKILSVDYLKLITGEIDESIVSIFNIDYNNLVDFFKNNEAFNFKNVYLYRMIENVLLQFTLQINLEADKLAEQISERAELLRVKEHIKRIADFLESKKIKDAILIQEKDEEEHPEKYGIIYSDMPYEERMTVVYKKRKKGVIKNLVNALKKYLRFLQYYQQRK